MNRTIKFNDDVTLEVPEHPRFKWRKDMNGIEQWSFEIEPGSWIFLAWHRERKTLQWQSCCAVARCAFLDKAKRMRHVLADIHGLPPEMVEEMEQHNQEAVPDIAAAMANVEAWAKEMARCEVNHAV